MLYLFKYKAGYQLSQNFNDKNESQKVTQAICSEKKRINFHKSSWTKPIRSVHEKSALAR